MADDGGVGLILLAAGKASRFGGDKMRASLAGRPLLSWAMEACGESGIARKVLVVREDGALDPPKGWQVVVNTRAEEGQSTSIRAGVDALRTCSRIVIALGDMPFVTAAHLTRLAEGRGSVFTRYPDGRRGCPAAFPPETYGALMSITGDKGAASLDLPGAQGIAPADGGPGRMLADIDTAADLARLSPAT